MSVVKCKPTSPGRRHVIKVVHADLHKGKPYAPLLEKKSKSGGRNNNGRITTRHIGGGHKQHYRMVDFKRNKVGIPATVERIEYDPNRSAFIALTKFDDNEKRYIVALKGLKVGDKIVSGSKKLDWEVELGIIIGKEAKHISEDKAQDHILGYCLVNDVSEREWQIEKMGQWVKGKSHDTYGPIGPYLVTKDEVADINNLKMSLDVNGNRMQNGNTSTMIFNVNVIVSYVSKFMSLQPGDIITTGTPPGVGMGMKPQQFLKAGDTMKLSIENLGEQNSKVVAL